MNTLKDLEDDIEEKYSKSPNRLVFKVHTGGLVNSDYKLIEARDDIKELVGKISNQIIEEIIGEEKEYGDAHDFQNGYNCKVQELKLFKKKFNA